MSDQKSKNSFFVLFLSADNIIIVRLKARVILRFLHSMHIYTLKISCTTKGTYLSRHMGLRVVVISTYMLINMRVIIQVMNKHTGKQERRYVRERCTNSYDQMS